MWQGMVMLAGAVVHVLSLAMVHGVASWGKDYPWHVLRWTFPLGAAAFCLPIALLAMGPMILLAIAASCLQTVLLWRTRSAGEIAA